MYSDFLKICEAKLLEGSVLDALYLYGNIDYLSLVSPKLKNRKAKEVLDINVIEPISEEVFKKLPKFKGEFDVTDLIGKHPKLNPVSFDDNQAIKTRLKVIPKLDNLRTKFRGSDQRKYTNKKI